MIDDVQRVLVVAWLGSGCSLLYNPNNLPDQQGIQDARADAEIVLDADPTAIELERVSPALLFEGTGDGGSRRGVITVHGKQLVKGARISIASHAGEPLQAMITVDDDATDVADNGFFVAAPISISVDPLLGAADRIRLDVTVTQPGPSGDVVATLVELPAPATPDTPVLELQGLGELTDDTNGPLSTASVHEFSRVDITGALAAADTNKALIVRARASVSVGAAIDIRAVGRTKGPNGNDGGSGGAILGAGAAGQGPGGGKPSGGGGGFGEPGTGGNLGGAASGNPQITTHAANRSSGGAGGDGGAVSGGGAGGGGGGSIEITAGGALAVAGIDARGGNGATGADDGGGGSGGMILLRGTSVASSGTLDVRGGTGKNAGGVGRIRIDVAGAATPATTPTAFRGPMFATDTPLLTRDSTPLLKVFGTDGSNFTYRIFDDTRTQAKGPFAGSIAQGSNTFELAAELFRGLNTICLTVDAGNDTNAEATNCIDIVYVTTI